MRMSSVDLRVQRGNFDGRRWALARPPGGIGTSAHTHAHSGTPRGTHARPVAPSGVWRVISSSRSSPRCRSGRLGWRGLVPLCSESTHSQLSTCCSTVGSPACPWRRPSPGSYGRRQAKVRGSRREVKERERGRRAEAEAAAAAAAAVAEAMVAVVGAEAEGQRLRRESGGVRVSARSGARALESVVVQV